MTLYMIALFSGSSLFINKLSKVRNMTGRFKTEKKVSCSYTVLSPMKPLNGQSVVPTVCLHRLTYGLKIHWALPAGFWKGGLKNYTGVPTVPHAKEELLHAPPGAVRALHGL